LCFVKEATLYDEFALRKGFLQSWDPRVKMAVFLLFIITAVSLKDPLSIGVLYCLCFAMAISSRIPAGFFLMRTWVFIPLFSLIIAVPALFSFVTPGEAVASFHFSDIHFIITRPGLNGAILFVARVTTTVSLAVLLSLTTRHVELLKVLRTFGIPQMFVLTIAMCYRYLFLFADMIENIFTGIKSRVGVIHHHREGRRIVAWNIANMWNRANQMNEEVYNAMLSRGYTGEPRLLTVFRIKRNDWAWMFGAVVLCAGLFFWGRS